MLKKTKKKKRYKDISGARFGRLVAIEPAGNDKHDMLLWKCKCECGKYITTRGTSLRYGATLSCGCLQREIVTKTLTTHGLSGGRKNKTRLYRIWSNMKSRCFNESANKYRNYGGRGISVCREWLKYEPFHMWAKKNGYKEGLTLDRIDNDGDYSPKNCRWATYAEQSLNSRANHLLTHNGKTQPIAAWAREKGMRYETLHSRIADYGWTVGDAIETPVREWRSRHEAVKA